MQKNELLKAYSQMLLARKIDEKCIILYKQNKCHFQIGCAGHEAVTHAASQILNRGKDWVFPHYRDMALMLALGMTPEEIFLNALNKAADPNSGGRMMPMHWGHKDLRIVNASSPTATQFLQAVGAAQAVKHSGGKEIVLVCGGEGMTAEGSYYEALNWAARKKLPLVILIEDNSFAISVPLKEQVAGGDVAEVASGFKGIEIFECDGCNYQAAKSTLEKAARRARSGKGCSLVVAKVIRLQSHSISDNQLKYRRASELAVESKLDPLKLLRTKILRAKISTEEKLKKLEKKIQAQVDSAAEWAEQQADPEPESYKNHVLDLENFTLTTPEVPASGEELFLVDAINHALKEEMELNPNMLIYGQDVARGKGGVFGVTEGLTKKFGEERVFNAPLAESSIVGTAIGMGVVGLKPVVEIQFGDYCWTAMMDIRNELATLRYRSNNTFSSAVVIRIPVGGYIHGGVYHSQNIEATFAHFPGLLIAYPSNAADAKGLLKAAIRGSDPVLFLEHKGLYRQVYAKSACGDVDGILPFGKGRICREGQRATVVSWGALVQKSLVAAENIFKDTGESVEVIDLRTIYPLDIELILNSVKKTSRLLIAQEDSEFMGFGAEIAAQLATLGFEYLDAPILRLGGKFTPVPHSAVLERAVLPHTADVEAKIRELLAF